MNEASSSAHGISRASTSRGRLEAAEQKPSIVDIHDDHWRSGEFVAQYAHRRLRPAEVIVLARCHRKLSGRVLELGCGAGRVLSYLVSLSETVVGIDVSEAMVRYCRSAYPKADVRLGEIGALNETVAGPFDAVVAADNVLGGFEDADRRRVLRDIWALLEPGGMLIFSAHNLADVEQGRPPGPHASVASKLMSTPPDRALKGLIRLPRRLRNRRRLAPLQYRKRDHALLNDSEGDFGVLHYYINHADQRRQLRDTGYELVECIDAEGRTVHEGEQGEGPWLYYVGCKSFD